MQDVRRDDGRAEQEPRLGLDIRGDLGSAMRIVGGEGVDEACRDTGHKAVVPGDTNEGSARNEGGGSQDAVVGESVTKERDEKGEERPGGGGAETAGVREDQHGARSSRRVGLVCAPRNYKRPQSLQNLKSNGQGGYSSTISSGGTTHAGPNGTTTTTTRTPPVVVAATAAVQPTLNV